MTLFIALLGVLGLAWGVSRVSRRLAGQKAALHDAEARFRILFEASPYPVWVMDGRRCLLCNPATVEALGLADQEALKNTDPAEFSPEFQPDGENSVSKAERMMELARDKGRQRFEWTFRRRDGCEFGATVILDATTLHGRPALQFQVCDVTAQRAQAQVLEQFKDVLDQVHDCVFMCDLDTLRFIYVNRGAIEQVGYDEQALLGMHPYDIKPDYPEPQYRARIAPLLSGEQPFLIFETRHRHRDGHDVPVEVFLQLVRTGRQASRIVAIVRDISERQRGERALRRSEERLRAILDNVDAYIYLKDTDGNYLFANAATCRLWQVEMENIVGYGDEAVFDAATAAAIRRDDRKVLEEGIALRGEEAVAVKGAGQAATFLTIKIPLRKQDGSIYGLCGISTDISDRKQMEESLRKRERDLNEAQHIARVGSWELDVPGQRLAWSDEFVRILELDPATPDAGYDAFLARIHPEDREAVDKAYADSLRTHRAYGIRHRLLMADGRIKHVHTQCRTEFDAAGSPLRSFGTVQDVTEEVQAEAALRDTRSLLQTVIDHAPMRVFWKDRALNYLGGNPPFARDAGLDHPGDLIGRSDFELAWTNEADRYRADDRKVIESGVPQLNYEEPQTTPDGRTIWLRTSKVPLRNQAHEIIGILGIYDDITEEKAKDTELARYRGHLEQLVAERSAQLAEARIKYQRLLDDMGDEFLAFSFTPDVRLTYVSNGFEAIFGIRREEVLGQPFNEVVRWQPADLEESMGLMLDMFAGNSDSIRTEMRFVHPDGSVRTIYQTCRAVRNAAGEVVSVDGVLTDITRRKRTETELLQAKRAAEAASRAKSAFLANMSHEIRTPMNGVIGMLEILSHSPLPGDERRMVDTVRRSARSLLGIIDDILDFSKIEAGKLSLVEQEMSIEAELDIVIGLIDQIAMDKGVALSTFFDPDLPQCVVGDGLRVRQILTNLAGNAVKFTSGGARAGRVRLRAALERQEGQRVWVAFTVADNGIGMDAETLARLFQPFVQADSSTTRKYGGTGLGLSISHNLASMMGGDIAVNSAPGQGTTFTLRLPFTVASECPNPLAPYDLGGLECIVVADDAEYVDDYSRYLGHAGACTHGFPDLDVAWRFASGYAPEVPVCMIVMEGPAIHSAQEVVDRLLARQPKDNVHFVEVTYLSLERGRRRRVRRLSERIVQIDREAMTRRRFLEAAAAACGRVFVPQQAEDEGAGEAGMGGGLKILVAEDNEVNRDVIRRQLEMLGHRVDVEVDGQDAFRTWESGHYDLLLTDLHMPNKDGYELTAMIREAERRQGLSRRPIVALTANAMKGEQERCLAQGMDAYLTKPIELARLKAVLDQWQPPTASSAAGAPGLPAALAAPELAEVPELPVFDPEVLSRMVGNNPAVHRRLLGKFLGNAEERTRELLGACAAGDAATVGQIAHSLKSAARSVGALRLGDVCEQLERAGKAGNMQVVQRLLSRYAQEHAAAATALEPLSGKPEGTQ